MKRLSFPLLAAASIATAGCAAMAEGYMTGVTGYHVPPKAGTPSATLVFKSLNPQPINSDTVDVPLSYDYTVTHRPRNSRDKTSVRLMGYGQTVELPIRVDRPVYVSAMGYLTQHTCANEAVFDVEAGHSYSITQVYAGSRCRLQITDLETNTLVSLHGAAAPR